MSPPNLIYCDNAASTPIKEEVLAVIQQVNRESYGNPSSLHQIGLQSKKILDEARQQVANLLNCSSTEIVFTSGGTEANNLALEGLARAHPHKKHLISTPIEHSSVHEPLKRLEQQGYEVTFLAVDADGFISLAELKEQLRADTLLVSVVHANNEIGTVQDLAGIGALCREVGVYFHTDAVQSAGKLPLDVQRDRIDLLSLSAHKLYGPKGSGALYVRQGITLEALLAGGPHEAGRRAGTQNLSGIAALGKAAELAKKDLNDLSPRLEALSKQLYQELSRIPDLHWNGPQDFSRRVPGNLNFSLPDLPGDRLLLQLDLEGVCVSSGSACSAGILKPSRVLQAIRPQESEAYTQNAIRISLGCFNDAAQIPLIASRVQRVVERLRCKKTQNLQIEQLRSMEAQKVSQQS